MDNKRVLLACLHLFLLVATICTFFSMLEVAHATVINVPDDYPTIGEAIAAASDDYTIQVTRRSGQSQSVYYERLLIDKELTLVGEGRENVIIDGSGAGSVIRIRANNVEIRGFTIRNGGQRYNGIRASGYSYVTVANNTIEANKKGVSLLNSYYNTIVQNLLFSNYAEAISVSESIGNNISDNHVSESAYGIMLSFTNSTFVVGNTVSDGSYGIYLQHSSNDTVDKNTLLRNQVNGIFPYECHDIVLSNNDVSGSAYAIELHSSHTITVLGNKALENSYGVYLAYSGPSNTIENNTVSTNDWGVKLYNSSSNTFKGNTLSRNTYGVDPVTDSHNNLLYHNNFVENIEQVVWNPDCLNIWDDGSQGNYWSDYTGTDSDGDGVGDTAYSIDPMNRDRCPLMIPWGAYHDVAVIEVTSSDTEAYVGETVNITVVAENHGTYAETFNVTARYENTTHGILGTVGTQEIIDLAPEQNVTLPFSWNTTDIQPCVKYTITADATAVPDELDTSDNTFVDGTVKVKIMGDINGDGIIDILDLNRAGKAYGSSEGEPEYDPEVDLNKDGHIDMRDIAVICRSYGKTC